MINRLSITINGEWELFCDFCKSTPTKAKIVIFDWIFQNQVLVFKPQNEEIDLYKTKKYRANYSVILDINRGENENSDITFIVGLNEDNIINIHWMSFKAHVEMGKFIIYISHS